MFYVRAALRNLKFNKLTAALIFLTVLSACALTTFSLRVYFPARAAFNEKSTYRTIYEAMSYTTAFATVACVICAAVMLYGLAPAASDKKKAMLAIYSDIGATKGQLFAINLIEMLIPAVFACPLGIISGEVILYTRQSWISAFAGAIVWQNGTGVRIIVAAATLILVVLSCLAYSFRPAPKIDGRTLREGVPSRIYAGERGSIGLKLGWVNFIRRKRPTSVFVMVLTGLIVFNALCNGASYAARILQSDIIDVKYDYNVSFTYDLYDECMEIYERFNRKYDCTVFSSPNVRIYWTTEVTEVCAEEHTDGQTGSGSNCIEMIVPDEDFEKLIEEIGAVISPNEIDGMSAILINHAYSYSDNYKPYNIFENTAVPSYGTLNTTYYLPEASAPVTVVSYTNEWPEGYDYPSYMYGLIMRRSDYLKYFDTLTGEYYSGLHYIRFSNAEGIYDEIYGYISENYDAHIGRGTGTQINITDKDEARVIKSETITFVENYINLAFAFAAAVLFLNIVFMLNREAESRKDEFEIYRSLGIRKSTAFAMLFTDCFLYFATAFGMAFAASLLLLLPLHWLILGYYASFYVEWVYPVICLAALTVVSALFALHKAVYL